MIRVVLDTNVVVSAQLNPIGLEAAVVLLCVGQRLTAFFSPPILEEYRRVLSKPKFRLEAQRVEAVLGEINGAGRLVRPSFTLTAALDEPDNRFLECAFAAHADFLVTGNKRHFPANWEPSRIVNARELFREMPELGRGL